MKLNTRKYYNLHIQTSLNVCWYEPAQVQVSHDYPLNYLDFWISRLYNLQKNLQISNIGWSSDCPFPWSLFQSIDSLWQGFPKKCMSNLLFFGLSKKIYCCCNLGQNECHWINLTKRFKIFPQSILMLWCWYFLFLSVVIFFRYCFHLYLLSFIVC